MSYLSENISSSISSGIFETEDTFFGEHVNHMYVEKSMKGLKIATVTNIKDNFNVEVHIHELDIIVIAPMFYANSLTINVGDVILVYVDDLFTFKALAVHPRTESHRLDKRGETKISNGVNEIILGDDGVTLSLDGQSTTYTFKRGGINVLSKDTLNVTIANRMRIYFKELDLQGNTFDLITGSLVSVFKPTIFVPDGISLRSFIGNVDIISLIGNVNISSGTFTNIGSLMMTNVISTGLVNITAPLIPNLTIGFFAPLLPSPVGVIGFKSLFTNLASPMRTPLPVFGDDIIKKVRDFLPI